MRGSTTTGMIVASEFGRANELSLGRNDADFRDNTYNEESTPMRLI